MTLSDPAAVMARLEAIERDFAELQGEFEQAAMEHYIAKREKEKHRAEQFLAAVGTVAERWAVADKATALDGYDAEAKYEAYKAVVRVLESRASIGQSILRAMGRA